MAILKDVQSPADNFLVDWFLLFNSDSLRIDELKNSIKVWNMLTESLILDVLISDFNI